MANNINSVFIEGLATSDPWFHSVTLSFRPMYQDAVRNNDRLQRRCVIADILVELQLARNLHFFERANDGQWQRARGKTVRRTIERVLRGH
jgi:hypothetical protein